MQKWEHHVEMVTALTKMDDPGRSELYKKLRQLGENGWEMVGIASHRGDLWAFFKRPSGEKGGSGVKSQAQALRRSRPERDPR